MMAVQKAPFPYMGGKRHAAPAVWAALGDPAHYVEPFAGSLVVLLQRPALANRTYYSETVNDADGLLINALRGIQLHPDATAEAASWPVSEADLHARHLALVRWRASRELEHLMGDPSWCDPTMAGWWLWGIAGWIGGGWCSGTGAWVLGEGGRLVRGSGGVARQLPHVSDDGRGVNHPGLREPGVARQLPHVSTSGMGVNHPGLRETGAGEPEFHAMTMLELRRWFHYLSARLRHVRILNGDWRRAVTDGVLKTLSVRQGGVAGIFLDPPYADTAERCAGLYAHDSATVAHDVRAWAVEHGHDPAYRIVLASYEGEHTMPEDWTSVEWFAPGFLRGGYAGQSEGGTQQARERLYLSPGCLRQTARQGSLFEVVT